ncbi:MAG TPA: carboxymuconolactone decarboxylase family protein [Candidatus Dormibacteraeota bacterium]|nr:carboxymuconolactone decarboxylase family protein [Candidatus Dormibacteraeota bacterium]
MGVIRDIRNEVNRRVGRNCWGEVWTRPGLDKRMRSCITVAMLVALNHPEELKLHLRGALNNGVTPDELKEVLLQAAIYCGIPAAKEVIA